MPDHPDNVEFDHEAETTDSPLIQSREDDDAPVIPSSPAPQKIGRYKILRVIGEGGMGTVYEAEQEAPRRTVALKVIRSGAISTSLLSRFEHEAQILGKLDHTGIATIYEAGTFDSGAGLQPYFAMELIQGKTLTEYANYNKLGTSERLQLLSHIADALQHAHQKGVIHRDIKPGNILVTDEGQPKILDFGVARATDSDIQVTTIQTDIGQLIGTLPYMSPEQAAGNPDDLDTRSDVYALGVVAYELIAGRLPLDLTRKMIHEAVRMIHEDDPIPLSSINRMMRGDIEIIIEKALRKDKTLRYQSASEFASDIRHFLNDEPIIARRPSTLYQLKKFTKRNKAIVCGIGMVIVVLMIATGVSIRFAVREVDQRKIAQENQKLAEQHEADAVRANELAQQRANDLEQVVSFQENMLGSINPEEMGLVLFAEVRKRVGDTWRNRNISEEELNSKFDSFSNSLLAVNSTDYAHFVLDENILHPASEAIEQQFLSQPLIEAALRNSIGSTYLNIGLYTAAERELKRAYQLSSEILGDEHPDTLRYIDTLGMVFQNQGRLDQAEPLFTQTLDTRNRLFGPEHPDTLTSMHHIATQYWHQGHYENAEEMFVKTLELRRRELGEEHSDTLDTMNNLAVLYYDQNRFAQAETLLVDVLRIRQQSLGEEHPSTLDSMNNLAILYQDQGRREEAESLYVNSLNIFERKFGREHPFTLTSMNNLATLYRNQERYDEAELLFVETLELKRRILGNDHVDTIICLDNLGMLYQSLARYDEALTMLSESLAAFKRVMGEEHPDTLISMHSMCVLLRTMGRFRESEVLYRETIQSCEEVLGEDHRYTLWSMYGLSVALLGQEKFLEAETVARDCYQRNLAKYGPEHTETLDAINVCLAIYTAWHEAEPDQGHSEKVEYWRDKLPRNNPPEETGD